MKELVNKYEALVKDVVYALNEIREQDLNPHQLGYINNLNNQLKASLNFKAITKSDITENDVLSVWNAMVKDYDVRLRTNKISPSGVYEDIKNKIF